MSLQVWLPLDGDLNNQGLANVIITNNGAIVASEGKIGQCYQFTPNQWIKINLPAHMTTIKNTSICAWVKSTSSTMAVGGISNDTSNATCMTLYSSGWQFRGSSAWKYIGGGTVANTAVWHHVACTLDDNTITTYLDGTKVNTNTLTELGVQYTDLDTTTNFIEIGCDHPGGDEYFTGFINDFRVYDHALSPKEVKEISKCLLLHYKLDGKFLEDDAEYDCSGYNNETSIIGTLTDSTDTPRYNKSTKFNGSNSAIKIINNNWMPQGMSAMTINLWAKNSSWNSNTHFFSCAESGGFNTETGQSGYLRFPIRVYTTEDLTSTAYKYDSKELQLSALSITDWNMITWVYDSTGTKTYINGVLHHTYTNTSYGIYFNTNARLFLGCEASGANAASPYYSGYMSDFRLYATAFSADDILELYQTSASIDNKGNLFCGEVVE